jgi:hypothetical protein
MNGDREGVDEAPAGGGFEAISSFCGFELLSLQV